MSIKQFGQVLEKPLHTYQSTETLGKQSKLGENLLSLQCKDRNVYPLPHNFYDQIATFIRPKSKTPTLHPYIIMIEDSSPSIVSLSLNLTITNPEYTLTLSN